MTDGPMMEGLELITPEKSRTRRACHPPNSVRFKCKCGSVHEWPEGSRGRIYRCRDCGRLHGRSLGVWGTDSGGTNYGRDGCPGLCEGNRDDWRNYLFVRGGSTYQG